MTFRKLNRRKFLIGSLLAAPVAVWADADLLEPQWIRTHTVRIGDGKPTHRVVQISDIHHKGDKALFESVVAKVNALSPDIVCFTGDLVEKSNFTDEALGIMKKIKAPVYAVPGNHDYWSGTKFKVFADFFAGTGGAWLTDAQTVTADKKLCVTGAVCLNWGEPRIYPPKPGCKNILLIHYPLFVEKVSPLKFDLILAGHSHGGQVRVPFYGAVLLPFWVGKYEMGRYETASGPMYVNPGIGYIGTQLRFNCRPEITVFEI